MKINTPKSIIILLIILSATQNSYSQDEENKWVVGLGMNAIDFFPSNGIGHITGNNAGLGNELFNVEDHWNQKGHPKINISRHIWKRISADLAYTRNKIYNIGDFRVDDLSYSAIDLSVHYSILKDNYKLNPYVLIGAGHTSIDDKGTATFNSGIGVTYWFAEKFGVNGDMKFKYADLDYPMIQHFQYSVSIVHRFGSGRGKKGHGTECFE
ncbi:MAG: hypothetical protein COA67_03060 [Lutibacter sp.]|nr:MAG: hypothetical protein COA67_03060 [Lutibacter sp.]